MKRPPDIPELIATIKACDEMARRVGLRFIPDEWKLEALGLSSKEIDGVFAALDNG